MKVFYTTLGATLLVALLGGIARGTDFSAWGPPQKVDEINGNSSDLNTPQLDGCPIQSPLRGPRARTREAMAG